MTSSRWRHTLNAGRMNRRTFLGTGSLATGLFAMGGLVTLRAQDTRGLSSSPVVETRHGRVRGVTRLAGTLSFFGIPYGASTAGSGRFMPPARPASWSGVRNTVEFGARSYQRPSNLMWEVAATDRADPMSEECLFLNVHTPAVGGGRRPVMVWLHGGGYSTGSGSRPTYDGTNLARFEDVVVVSVNHRLNVFGYTYLGGLGERYAEAGNAGMRDIVLALEWVRDNIEAFGGDPGNVTIFGQSGGAGKVSTLTAMPPARGLFHKAIMMSGSNLAGVPASEATAGAEALLAKLGLRRDQVAELQRVPPEQLMEAAIGIRGIGSPVADGLSLPGDAWSPTAPALSANIPMMFGSTETETTFNREIPPDDLSDADLHAMVRRDTDATDAQVDHLITMYRRGRPGVSNTDLALIVASDTSFRDGLMTQAERKADQESAPAYVYYFTWRSPVRGGRVKAFHTLDIPFAFNTVDESSPMTGMGQDRYALADIMSGAFAAFARSGNPNHPGMPDWPRFDTTRRATMFFDNASHVVEDPYADARRAWYAIRDARS